MKNNYHASIFGPLIELMSPVQHWIKQEIQGYCLDERVFGEQLIFKGQILLYASITCLRNWHLFGHIVSQDV